VGNMQWCSKTRHLTRTRCPERVLRSLPPAAFDVIEHTTTIRKLSNDGLVANIDADAQQEDDIWVAQLSKHTSFLDKAFHSRVARLIGCVAQEQTLDRNGGTMPLRQVDGPITAGSNLVVDNEIVRRNEAQARICEQRAQVFSCLAGSRERTGGLRVGSGALRRRPASSELLQDVQGFSFGTRARVEHKRVVQDRGI